MQPEILQFFAKFIEKELGIVYADQNYFQLQNRLEEISKIFGINGIEELYAKALQGIAGNLRQLLLDVATNNETSFFRDPKVFQAIEKELVPAMISNLIPGEKIRIWSAASSYGQEAYSMTILLRELQKKGALKQDFEILATDIAERVLERAKTGRYSQLEVQRGLSAMLLVKYFTKDAQDYWTLQPEVLSQVQFKKQNLIEPLQVHDKFHLILCRNVLIYQKVESKSQVIKRLVECLVPGGYLVLGAGESLLGISEDFSPVPAEGVVLYQLKRGDK